MLFGPQRDKKKPIIQTNENKVNKMRALKKDRLFIIFQDKDTYHRIAEIEDDQEALKRLLKIIDIEKNGLVVGIIRGVKADSNKFARHKIDFGDDSPKEHDKIYVAFYDAYSQYSIVEFNIDDVKAAKKLLIKESSGKGRVHIIIRGRKANLIIQNRYKFEWVND